MDPGSPRCPSFCCLYGLPSAIQLILFTAAMQNVPVSLYEAAKLDGARQLPAVLEHHPAHDLPPTIFYLLITRTMAVSRSSAPSTCSPWVRPSIPNRSVVLEIYTTAFSKYEFGPAGHVYGAVRHYHGGHGHQLCWPEEVGPLLREEAEQHENRLSQTRKNS